MKIISDKNKEYWNWLNEFNTIYWPKVSKLGHIRKGQALFNYLYEKYPAIADKVSGSIYDCYYNDEESRIKLTLTYLKQNWESLKKQI